MKCKYCGFEFNETQNMNRGCLNCGKQNCNSIHCPNCGFKNNQEYKEFVFITKLKNRIIK